MSRKTAPIGPGRQAEDRTVPAPVWGRTSRDSPLARAYTPQVLRENWSPGPLSRIKQCFQCLEAPTVRSGVFLPFRLLFLSLVPVVPANGRGRRFPEAGSVHFRVGERAAAVSAAGPRLAHAPAASAGTRSGWRAVKFLGTCSGRAGPRVPVALRPRGPPPGAARFVCGLSRAVGPALRWPRAGSRAAAGSPRPARRASRQGWEVPRPPVGFPGWPPSCPGGLEPTRPFGDTPPLALSPR